MTKVIDQYTSDLDLLHEALNEQDIELEALREENAVLLAAIEAKDVAIVEMVESYSHKQRVNIAAATDISPSTELLEARDRKRDAKLIGLLSDGSAMSPTSRSWMLRQAADRESGEWIPELGDLDGK